MILEMKNIYKKYNNLNKEIKVLENFDLSIEKGDFISIMGKSGVGKSTLLNIIGLLDTHYLGEYKLNGIDVSTLKEKEKAKLRNHFFGFIMQEFHLIDRLTVLDNILVPLEYSEKGNQLNKKQKRQKVQSILESLNLSDKIDAMVKDLSGGQKQRVAIARALVNSPSIVIADEPTGSLDVETSKEILNILRQINKNGVTVILVTHDESLTTFCNKKYILNNYHVNSL